MKIYVASKFENVIPVRAAQDALRAAGHTIIFDWTPHYDAVMSGDERPLVMREQFAALDDHDGAVEADVLVLLVHPGMKGALVELGLQIGAGGSAILVGSAEDIRAHVGIFQYLPACISCNTIEEAIVLLRGEGA